MSLLDLQREGTVFVLSGDGQHEGGNFISAVLQFFGRDRDDQEPADAEHYT